MADILFPSPHISKSRLNGLLDALLQTAEIEVDDCRKVEGKSVNFLRRKKNSLLRELFPLSETPFHQYLVRMVPDKAPLSVCCTNNRLNRLCAPPPPLLRLLLVVIIIPTSNYCLCPIVQMKDEHILD